MRALRENSYRPKIAGRRVLMAWGAKGLTLRTRLLVAECFGRVDF
jgi:hypothetical protein